MDIDIWGREVSEGTPYEYYDEQAVKNALTLWISSKRGEFLKKPTLGGPTDSALFKNLSKSNIDKLKFRLTNAINNDFQPAIILRNINIIRNYENRYIQIDIMYSDPITENTNIVTVYTKDLTNVTQQAREDIPYKEENLKMFCLVQKPSLSGIPLVFNEDLNSWVWGKFNFINYDASTDSYAEEISRICNT